MPSSQGSRASLGSRGSGRYRTVNRNANVDESLFASDKPKSRNSSRGADFAVIDKENYSSMKAAASQGVKTIPDNESAVISGAELDRLKGAAKVVTAEEQRAAERAKKEAREQSQVAARLRKEKILAMEADRKKKEKISDLEQERRGNMMATVSRAQQLLDEELDDVKHMNQMMLYSKCVTIRDAQKAEKNIIAKERDEEERRLDMMMEIERLKAIKMYEDRELKRNEDRRRGAQIITEQMKEREMERLRQLELQDQEREAVLRQIEKLKQEEVEQQIAKKEAARRLMEEVAKSNQEQIARKLREKEDEKEEEQRIAEYLRQKELKEQEFFEEQEAIKAEKEKEVARMRAQQEKAQDKQAELDALRAKRAQESYEREWRAKEKAAAERQEAIQRELAIAREEQRKEKEKRLADQARVEREEFEKIIQVQREIEAAEIQKEEEEHSRLIRHADELREQIKANELARKKARDEFLEEGKQLRQKMHAESYKLEYIKQQKLGELRQSGVPDKYCAELERKKVS